MVLVTMWPVEGKWWRRLAKPAGAWAVWSPWSCWRVAGWTTLVDGRMDVVARGKGEILKGLATISLDEGKGESKDFNPPHSSLNI